MNQAQERLEALRRRRKVAKLYLEGNTQSNIAVSLEVSKGVIAGDLAFIRKEWLSEILTDFNEMKARELAKIDNLEAEAWEAWRKSCEPVTTTRKRTESIREHLKKGKGRTKGGHVLVPIRFHEETTVRDGGTGDPRFLEQVSWCIETRLRIANLLKGDTITNEVTINWAELSTPPQELGSEVLVLSNDPIEQQIMGVQNLSKVREGVVETNGDGQRDSGAVEEGVEGD